MKSLLFLLLTVFSFSASAQSYVETAAQKAGIGIWDILLVAVIIIAGVWFWWSKLSNRNPAKAAGLESELDAFTRGLKKYVPDQADAILERVASVNLTAAGQATWAVIERRLNTIEAKQDEILRRLPK